MINKYSENIKSLLSYFIFCLIVTLNFNIEFVELDNYILNKYSGIF